MNPDEVVAQEAAPRFKVVALRHGYADTSIQKSVVTGGGGVFLDTDGLSLEEALRHAEDSDAILVRWLRVDRDFIRRLRRCRIILRYGVGTDNVDVEAATEARIMVGHAPGYCLEEVAHHALALLLAGVRNVVQTHLKMVAGGWDANPPYPLHRMTGRTLGLVGFGNIGQSVARKLAGWDLRLLASDPFVEPERALELNVSLVDLETLCRESDYISLHVPLLPETRHLIGAREIAWMRPGVVLVNTSRGPVVDESVLVAALEGGRLAAVGLDVYEAEPLAADSFLRGHPRVVLTDHAAWYSEESVEELQRTLAEEAVRVCRGGLPRSLANPEVLKLLGRWSEWTPNSTAVWQLKRLERLAGRG